MLQVAAYYFAGSWASPGRNPAVPQPDTLLFCQSARQIAEGMPYVFTPGDRPSTGSTSHLYPFVLAVLYKAGATGDALLTAGFVLNALFYLVFLANWGLIVGRLASSPRAKAAACVLLVLNGHAAYGALSQSDVGLFMAVSSGIFAALLAGRLGWLAALLALSPWCRPEGAMLAVLYAGALIVRRALLRQRVLRGEWLAAGLALLSAVGVFALNYGLTGYVQFQSVYYKGYLKQYDLFPAVYLALVDLLTMVRQFFLGQPESMPRECFFMPLLGAAFAWLGLMVRPWRDREAWKEAWWLVAGLGGMAVVASSGWQNTNMDRYLVWLLPVWMIYTAEGAVWVGARLPTCAFRALPVLAVALFQAVGSACLIALFYSTSLSTQQMYDFGKEANALLPAGASVAGESAGLAYALSGRHMVQLSGIYSPDLLVSDPLLNIERLKHQPAWRFDYWALPSERMELGDTKIDVLCGPVVALGMGGAQLRPARWAALDCALLPLSVMRPPEAWKLVDRVDVGCPEDESRCGYTSYSRFFGSKYDLLGLTGYVGTNEVFEAGRVVLGSDSFVARLRPHAPVRIVLRTAVKGETGVKTGIYSKRQVFTFVSPLRLAVHANGAEVGTYVLPLSTNATAFSEVQFDLPPEAIQAKDTRLTLYGDHLALGYWLYQKE